MDSIIKFGHKLLKDNLSKTDTAIDMTVGNGNDSLFLVDIAKYVYCFDIQEAACIKSKEVLQGYDNFEIINDSHLNFDKYVNDFSGVIFNLGYLPFGSKQIHTKAEVVLETLKKVLAKINKNGICIIVFYPGHESGKEEARLICGYLEGLNQKEYDVIKYEFINQINNPPFLIGIKRRI